MNSAMVAAVVVQAPQLRYTQDDQTPVADFWVQFPSRGRQNTLKVTVWNDLAQAIVGLPEGLTVLLQGSLGIEKMLDNGVTKPSPRFTAREVFQLDQVPVGLRPQQEGVPHAVPNSVQLVGRLGSDPDTTFFESGSVVSNVSLAVNRKKKDAPPDWFPLVLWGQLAELAQNYLHKGSEIAVEGYLDYDYWSDRHTGEPRCKPIVRVNSLRFIGGKRDQHAHDPGPAMATASEADNDDVPF